MEHEESGFSPFPGYSGLDQFSMRFTEELLTEQNAPILVPEDSAAVLLN